MRDLALLDGVLVLVLYYPTLNSAAEQHAKSTHLVFSQD
jgi:hypothetical protein